MRRWLLRSAVLLVVLAAVAVAVGSRGTYDEVTRASFDAPLVPRGAPPFTEDCIEGAGRFWTRCVRMRGRVAFVQRRDSDGDGDVHLLVVSRLRAHVVKLARKRRLDTPSIGSTITVVGVEQSGASVDSELQAITLD